MPVILLIFLCLTAAGKNAAAGDFAAEIRSRSGDRGTNGAIVRHRLDNPKVSEKVWDKTRTGHDNVPSACPARGCIRSASTRARFARSSCLSTASRAFRPTAAAWWDACMTARGNLAAELSGTRRRLFSKGHPLRCLNNAAVLI